MIYSQTEKAWLDCRAEKIARERGTPLPVARSEAEAMLTRSRGSGHCALVIPFRQFSQLQQTHR